VKLDGAKVIGRQKNCHWYRSAMWRKGRTVLFI
jgi:hypothetical protein